MCNIHWTQGFTYARKRLSLSHIPSVQPSFHEGLILKQSWEGVEVQIARTLVGKNNVIISDSQPGSWEWPPWRPQQCHSPQHTFWLAGEEAELPSGSGLNTWKFFVYMYVSMCLYVSYAAFAIKPVYNLCPVISHNFINIANGWVYLGDRFVIGFMSGWLPWWESGVIFFPLPPSLLLLLLLLPFSSPLCDSNRMQMFMHARQPQNCWPESTAPVSFAGISNTFIMKKFIYILYYFLGLKIWLSD